MQFRAEVEGVEDLRAALEALGDDSTKAGRVALRKAANGLRDALREAAPVGTESTLRTRTTKRGVKRQEDYGRLRQNIRVREERSRMDNTILMLVHTGHAFWGAFLEFGTRKMTARPWMRPVVDSRAQGLVEEIGARLGASIQRIARANARRSRQGGDGT